jgi:hypothetical protein
MNRNKRINVNELIGKRFNHFIVVKEVPPVVRNKTSIQVQCDCGKIMEYDVWRVVSGHTKSCGCQKPKMIAEVMTTHGLRSHPLADVWHNMKKRCYSSKWPEFHRYGGRGITICDEWLNDLPAFYNWAINNGWAKGLELDREENDGNYSPSNCRFITGKANSNNTSLNVIIEYEGIKYTKTQLAEKHGLKLSDLTRRLRKGLSLDDALNMGVKRRTKQPEIKYAFGFIN